MRVVHEKYKAIVIGTSAGGLFALSFLLKNLPPGFGIPIIVVQHRSKDPRDLLEEVMQSKCKIRIKQADEKENIASGFVYTAPPDYHLLIESDKRFHCHRVKQDISTDRPLVWWLNW